MEQLVARQAHNLEVVRSSRASATTRSQTDTATSVRLLFFIPIPFPRQPLVLRRQQPPAKQQSTTRKRRGATCDARITDAKPHSTAHKRRGSTCDARITDAVPQTGRHKTTINRRPARIRRHATRPTTCAVPAPGVMNGAPTGDAANQPTRNNIQPPANVGAPLVTPE